MGGDPITFSLDDGGHHGPWTFVTNGGAGVYTQEICMFSNNFTLTRRQGAGAGSWEGSVEVIGFIQYRNTITIPNDESWIIQGTTDPETGLAVTLDARLSSGTPLDPSQANIVLRYARFSGQIAPLVPNPELVGFGVWFGGQAGTYGGAFQFEGGSSDDQNPVRLVFDSIIFDHNRAVSVRRLSLVSGLHSSKSSDNRADRAVLHLSTAAPVTLRRVRRYKTGRVASRRRGRTACFFGTT
eukprot:COSAG04_NODE_85_length_27560_cov_8.621245_2_plen_240_part_00